MTPIGESEGLDATLADFLERSASAYRIRLLALLRSGRAALDVAEDLDLRILYAHRVGTLNDFTIVDPT